MRVCASVTDCWAVCILSKERLLGTLPPFRIYLQASLRAQITIDAYAFNETLEHMIRRLSMLRASTSSYDETL